MLTLQVLGIFLVNKGGEVTAIVQNHVQALATRESSKSLFNTPSVFFLRLALPSIYGNTGGSDARDT